MYKSVVVIATIDRVWTRQYGTSVGDGGSGERKRCNEMQILETWLNGLRKWEVGRTRLKNVIQTKNNNNTKKAIG